MKISVKIAHIDHIRCGEPAARTYVVVPSKMTEEEFRAAVYHARDDYESVMAETPLYERGFVSSSFSISELRKLPAGTPVSAVIDDYEERKREREALDELAERKRKSFGWYLEQQGLTIVQRLTDDLHVDIDWGHKHGQRIRYDGIEFNDEWWGADDPNPLCGKEQ